MLNYLVDSEWRWSKCELPIKRHLPNARSKQEYLYQLINYDDQWPDHHERVDITLQRNFTFEEQTGFVWHKSWNLPEIKIQISLQEFQYLSKEYKQIKCEIMAVYPIRQGNSYYLNEVPVEGPCNKTIAEPNICFKFLKFKQTSFNHNRNKFCLLLWLYGENYYGDKYDIICLISSPIYVDSRKQARKKQVAISQSQNQLQWADRFLAPLIGSKGIIPNTSEGFLSYYGAQNIRNKIKHPFYICYHFDQVFKIYNNIAVENMDLVHRLQFIKSSIPLPTTQNNLFLLMILETNDKIRQKIIFMLEKWKFNYIEFSHPDNFMAAKWMVVSQEDLKNAYMLNYEYQLIKEEEENFRRVKIQERRLPKSEEIAQNNAVEPEYRTIIEIGRPRKQVKIEMN